MTDQQHRTMNDQERDIFFRNLKAAIIDGCENIDVVLREVWDEAQRQAAPTWQPIKTAPKDGT